MITAESHHKGTVALPFSFMQPLLSGWRLRPLSWLDDINSSPSEDSGAEREVRLPLYGSKFQRLELGYNCPLQTLGQQGRCVAAAGLACENRSLRTPLILVWEIKVIKLGQAKIWEASTLLQKPFERDSRRPCVLHPPRKL